MAGVNKVFLVGRLGQAPDCKTLPSGDVVANFSMATSETYMDKSSGQKKEITEWHRVTAFGKLAEIIQKYVTKGSQVHVEGKIKYRKYTGKDGIERHSTDIVAMSLMMLDSKNKSEDNPPPADNYKSVSEGTNPFNFDQGDDLPF